MIVVVCTPQRLIGLPFRFKTFLRFLATFFSLLGLTSVFQPSPASELHDEKRVGFGGRNVRFDRLTPFIAAISA